MPDARAGARPRARADAARRRPLRPPDVHGDARAAPRRRRPRPRASLLGGADRRGGASEVAREDRRRAPVSGLPEHLRRPRQHRRPRRRAAWRGIELEVRAIGARRSAAAGRARPPLRRRRPGPRAGARRAGRRGAGARRSRRRSRAARRCSPSAAATSSSAASTATGRASSCRERASSTSQTIAGERRMIGDVLLECELEPGRAAHARRVREPRRDARSSGRTPSRSAASSPGFGNDGESGFEGCRRGRALGTYLHGPLLPRNPWLADWLLGPGARAPDGRRAAAARAAAGRARAARPRRSPPSGPGRAAAASTSDREAVPRPTGVGTSGLPPPASSVARGRSPRRAEGARVRADSVPTRARRLPRPERAEIDGRVAGLPAREEALDRRMERQARKLLERRRGGGRGRPRPARSPPRASGRRGSRRR